jgi:pimeloyl-ACP methyl ester carboxylesterase
MNKNNSSPWMTFNELDISVRIPREQTIAVNGIKTHYLECGPKKQKNNNRHLLFIHGLGSSADRWLDIPLALSFYFHTVALDLPGSGMSAKPPPTNTMQYTIQDYANFIVEFMRKIGIDKDEKASLVGHSLGGYIAAKVAIQHKELVGDLVLVDASGMLDGPTPLLKQYLQAALNPTHHNIREVFEKMVANPIRISDALVNGFIYRIGLQGARDAFVSAFNNSVNTQIGEERLAQIRSRTLLIWGLKDELIPIDPYCKIFRQAIKASKQVIIEDAGHAPFAEKPAVFSEVLKQFLRGPY